MQAADSVRITQNRIIFMLIAFNLQIKIRHNYSASIFAEPAKWGERRKCGISGRGRPALCFSEQGVWRFVEKRPEFNGLL